MIQRAPGLIVSLILLLALFAAAAFVINQTAPDKPIVALAVTPQPTILPTGAPTGLPSTPQPTASATGPVPGLTVVYVTRTGVPTSVPETPNPTRVAEMEKLQLLIHYFFEEPGTVIAEGINATPVPDVPYHMLSYKVAEITLPQVMTHTYRVPISGTLQPQLMSFSRVWRLTITGGPFIPTDYGYQMYLDDIPVGDGVMENGGLTTIIFDPLLLREGARIGLSYGHYPPVYSLPERLHLTRQPSP